MSSPGWSMILLEDALGRYVEQGWGNPIFLTMDSTPLGNHVGGLYLSHSSNQSLCCSSALCLSLNTEPDVFLQGGTVVLYCEEVKYTLPTVSLHIPFVSLRELFTDTLKEVSSPLNFNLLFPCWLLCIVWNQWLGNTFNILFYFCLWCVQHRMP